jgi:hypothetical protein
MPHAWGTVERRPLYEAPRARRPTQRSTTHALKPLRPRRDVQTSTGMPSTLLILAPSASRWSPTPQRRRLCVPPRWHALGWHAMGGSAVGSGILGRTVLRHPSIEVPYIPVSCHATSPHTPTAGALTRKPARGQVHRTAHVVGDHRVDARYATADAGRRLCAVVARQGRGPYRSLE